MPQFMPGESKTAKATMSNPKGVALDYTGFLYFGDIRVVEIPFRLNAGEEKVVSFPVTIPSATGTYSVLLYVYSSGQGIGLYKATEDAVIAAPALPFTFTDVSAVGFYDFARAGYYCMILFKATISNPNNVSVTHTLQVMMNGFDLYYNMYQFQNYPVQPFPGTGWAQPLTPLTLAPGQSYQLVTDFWNTQRQAFDTVLIPYQYWIELWLQDELGNKSNVVRVTVPDGYGSAYPQ
jgi:hypothetical protein